MPHLSETERTMICEYANAPMSKFSDTPLYNSLMKQELRLKCDTTREVRRQGRRDRARSIKHKITFEKLPTYKVAELIELCKYIGIPLTSRKKSDIVETIKVFKGLFSIY